ncbi:transcriptional regulator NRG1 [Chaetomidium leptoderma]|uniref:Transcriptional regulator NRG1 n=1 Tax=Chaetomidium leptoderma TaxID=669021 RepID=A0AAN6VUR5_9PEZI|nr:transcriptional regulator NRG1 [Chaetomidium leptoderma]
MNARDASGRRVSLLNDDDAAVTNRPHAYSAPSYHPHAPRAVSTPATPELFRSNSYDSHMTTELVSPATPLYDPPAQWIPGPPEARSYDEYYADAAPIHAGTKRRPSAISDGYPASYEDDATPATASSERPGKRFPCRYRDIHGCDKTFTTSGHASRHSKIHTAEKAVPCSFKDCTKKFTRADNMKQHLETHYKDKSRSSTSSRPSMSSSERRSSSSVKSSSRSKAAVAAALAGFDPLPSPIGGAFDLASLNVHLKGRPHAVHSPTSGLDTLAMAVACQGDSSTFPHTL